MSTKSPFKNRKKTSKHPNTKHQNIQIQVSIICITPGHTRLKFCPLSLPSRPFSNLCVHFHGLNSIFQLLDVRRWRHAPGPADFTPTTSATSKRGQFRWLMWLRNGGRLCTAPDVAQDLGKRSGTPAFHHVQRSFQFLSQSQNPKTKTYGNKFAHMCQDFFSSTEIRVPAINISSACKSSKRRNQDFKNTSGYKRYKMILEDKLGKNEKDHIAHILINTSSQKLACAKISVVQATCLLSIVRNSSRISTNGNGSKCRRWLRTELPIQNWHYVPLVSTRPKPFTKTLGKKTCKTLVLVRVAAYRFPLPPDLESSNTWPWQVASTRAKKPPGPRGFWAFATRPNKSAAKRNRKTVNQGIQRARVNMW